MKYKGYEAVVYLDDEAEIFHGEIINIRDVVTFQGTSVEELKQAFQDSVDDYLSFCASRNEQPDKPFSGKFMVRISPQLHQNIYTQAKQEGKSLNGWIEDKLSLLVEQNSILSLKR